MQVEGQAIQAANFEIPKEWSHARPFVNGKTDYSDFPWEPVVDPANYKNMVGRCALAGVEETNEAVDAANRAFKKWAGLGPQVRADLMIQAAERLSEKLPYLVNTLVMEVGKVLNDARGDVGGAIALLRYFSSLAPSTERIMDVTQHADAGAATSALIQRIPLGPIAVITPWNAPVYLCFNSVAPALISGCTVVVKPSEVAPLALTAALTEVAKILPPGVLNVIPGKGSVVGETLTAHRLIRGISFTGGTETGRRVLESAAGTIKKTSMELGGNDPAIVLASAEIGDDMLREIVAGSYSVSGQVCFNIKRIYVHRDKYEEFVEKFKAMVDQIVVGNGFDERSHMGPLTTEEGFRNAQRLIKQSKSNGAEVHEGGIRLEGTGWESGYFVRPSVVTKVSTGAELVTEEQFAPIIPVIPFDNDEEVIREANRTDFGLASSVWSADPAHAKLVAKQIEAGNTFINVHRVGASVRAVPFGGIKQSGIGRNHGEYSLDFYTEEHAIVAFSDPTQDLPGLGTWNTLTSH